jgi:NADH dehydrogenase FAD-containing subunit
MRIVVLDGGFGDVATVDTSSGSLRRRTDVEITLVSREERGSSAS